jgi:phosphate:Na+ symporter
VIHNYSFLDIAGSLALFLYGIKLLSDGLQKVAGTGMRQLLNALTHNVGFGVLSGLLLTLLLQTSSAATVLIVSFANSGMLSLTQSISLVIGSNIGTTVTAWLVSAFGISKFPLVSLALPIVAIGVPLMFFKRDLIRFTGEMLLGFALLILGFSLLEQSVPDLREQPELLEFFKHFIYEDAGVSGKIGIALLFVLFGILISIAVQTSSAAIALIQVLAFSGWVSLPLGIAIVLGANIGTTITANIAALVGNVHAKRTAAAHTLINALGVLWALLLFGPGIQLTDWITFEITGYYVGENPQVMPVALSVYHTSFNILNGVIMMLFVPFIARTVSRWIKVRSKQDDSFQLEFIGNRFLDASEFSTAEARQALARFGLQVKKGYDLLPQMVTEVEETNIKRLVERIQQMEDLTDEMDIQISEYLSHLARRQVSGDLSRNMRAILSISNHLENTADIILSTAKYLEKRRQQNAYFTPIQRNNVMQMAAMVRKTIVNMNDLLQIDASRDDLKRLIALADQMEENIDQYYEDVRTDYLERIEKGKFKAQSSMYYMDTLKDLERIADNVHAVTRTLREWRS